MRTDVRLSHPALPGLGLLGDQVRLAEALAAVDEELLSCDYLRYKPATSAVAGLTLASGPAFGLAVAADGSSKLTKTVDRARAGSVLLSFPAAGLVIARPAADRDLPALAVLGDVLRQVLARELRPLSWRQLRYKPQRRWVGALTAAHGRRAVVRVYRREDVRVARSRLALAASLRSVRAPQLVATSNRMGVLVLEWLAGTTADRLVKTTHESEALTLTGSALARLQRETLNPSVQLPAPDPRPVRAVADQVAALLPAQAARVRDLAARLLATAPSPAPSVLCHGDFSADQVVIDDSGAVGFVDWDRAYRGQPAADLATALAACTSEAQRSALYSGYASLCGHPAELDWHLTRARMLRLDEPLKRGSGAWSDEVIARIDQIAGELP